MGNSDTKEKKEKRYIPVHTKRLTGHKPRDLIIIYSKYEDLILNDDNDTTGKGLYIPQWLGINYVSNNRGLTMRFDELTICTYEEMAKLGIKIMNDKLAELNRRPKYHQLDLKSVNQDCKLDRVFFFYHNKIMALDEINALMKVYK